MFRNYKLKNFDFLLVALVITLNVIGILAIGSAKQSVQGKQMIGMGIGLVLMLIVAFLDYTKLLKLAWFGYAFAIVTLVLVLFFGREANGAKRWLDLGFFDLQPSETAKILLILFYAQFIMKYKERLNTPRILLSAICLILPPLALIHEQPNLSTTILVALLFCVLLFVGGLSWKIIGSVLAVVVPTVLVFLSIVVQEDQTLLKDYQRNRIMAFFNPQAYADAEAYQQINSVIAIGSGQLWGKGLNNTDIASVKNANFLPESQTDFIFAIIGEELGFIGSAAVIILLMLIAVRCVSIARSAKDIAGMVIASGVGALIGIQGFMNIAVATMLMPNTGLPLPFVSYGLSSLVSVYIGIGLVLNVGLQRKNLYNL